MKFKLLFAVLIFSLLFIIPSISLNYLETKVLLQEEIPTDKKQTVSEQKMVSHKEDTPIKVYDLNTNKVVVVGFEEYVKGVVAGEMPAEFESEALKAQAVTARTYLLYKLKKYPNGQPEHQDAPICTGTHCQVWYSKEELINKYTQNWYDTYWSKIEEAVDSTKGQILTYDNKIIEPLFHSTSGGRTENSEDVFTSAVPYLRSVDSPYETASPKLKDSVKLPINDFINKLKTISDNVDITPNNLKSTINLVDISEGGKVKTLQIGNNSISGRDIRSLFSLNSTNFSFIQSGNEIEIVTSGYGHGVGMSQWGANGMAQQGYSYKEILKHYYTGINIVDIK